MSQTPVQYRLPNLLAPWPHPRIINPHYTEVKAASAAWLESFSAFNARAQVAFNLCDFNLLAALAYHYADKERLRTSCDLMNLFFVIDEYSDIMDEKDVKLLSDVVMDAIRNPDKERPQGEGIYGEIARQYWKLATQTATPTSQRRFIDTFQDYLDAVTQEAADRGRHHIRSIDQYMTLRRSTVGAWPSFALAELELDIPDHVMNHFIVKHLRVCIIDILIIANDVYSYNVEQAHGKDGHNLVTIAMNELKTDIHGAMEWIDLFNQERMSSFLAKRHDLPKWGKNIDSQINEYIDNITQWVTGNDCWCFESERYFGKKGMEIQKTRMVPLLPKAH